MSYNGTRSGCPSACFESQDEVYSNALHALLALSPLKHPCTTKGNNQNDKGEMEKEERHSTSEHAPFAKQPSFPPKYSTPYTTGP